MQLTCNLVNLFEIYMFQYATMLYHKILTLGSCVAATLTEQLETLDEAFEISAGQLGAHALLLLQFH